MKLLETLADIGLRLHEVIIKGVEFIPFVDDGQRFLGLFSVFLFVVILLAVLYSMYAYKQHIDERGKEQAVEYMVKYYKGMFLLVALALASWLVS